MISRCLRVSVAALASGLAFTACSGQVGADVLASGGQNGSSNTAATQQQQPAPAPAVATRAGLPDFTGLVEHYGPAVVNIDVVGKSQPVAEFPGMSPNDPFYEFFRRFGRPMPRGGEAPREHGEGSGFIVSPDGYILTNAHVVQNADEVTVRLTDRREFTAKVVGVDERTDVAVIKIDAKDLPTVRIGDPSQLRPGQWVIAIGSPFGFENSVTAGIVSATSRALPGEPNNPAPPFIQTDVAVNPGNSGGPLFNLDGEVVGINSQIYSRTGGYMGLSFAVPIDVANNVREQLVKYGKVTRSRIGVSIQDVTAQLAESFGLDRPRGALIGMVEDNSPGEKGGLKPGDVILSVDGTKIDRSAQVPGLIANKKPGSKVSIEVWRDGATKNLTVRPEEIKSKGERVASNDSESTDEAEKLGLEVRPLQPDEKRAAKTQGNLVVEDVDGPAQEAGVRPGDIILGVNGKSVKTLDDLRSAAKKRNGKVVALLIERDNSQIFLPVRIG